MRIKLGLKLWSTNVHLIPEVVRYTDLGSIDYVELFCVPDRVDELGDAWKALDTDFVIHAPHSLAGLNFSIASMSKRNRELAEQSFRLADRLKADTVIFHPGIGGTLEETIRQASKVHDSRLVFENKPKIALDGQLCIGYSFEDIRTLSEELKTRICLDFGHAIAAANADGFDPIDLIDLFLGLNPVMFHLTDGDYAGIMDQHDSYGKGSFPLKILLSKVPTGSRVTNEAKRLNSGSIDEFIADRDRLFALFR